MKTHNQIPPTTVLQSRMKHDFVAGVFQGVRGGKVYSCRCFIKYICTHQLIASLVNAVPVLRIETLTSATLSLSFSTQALACNGLPTAHDASSTRSPVITCVYVGVYRCVCICICEDICICVCALECVWVWYGTA